MPPTITYTYNSDAKDKSERIYIERLLLAKAAYQSQGMSKEAVGTFKQLADGKPYVNIEPLYLKESLVPMSEKEKSIFDGLEK